MVGKTLAGGYVDRMGTPLNLTSRECSKSGSVAILVESGGSSNPVLSLSKERPQPF